jgi:hypothetical protein
MSIQLFENGEKQFPVITAALSDHGDYYTIVLCDSETGEIFHMAMSKEASNFVKGCIRRQA